MTISLDIYIIRVLVGDTVGRSRGLPFFMPIENLSILALLTLNIIREIVHYRQTSRLQELLKAVDITEYYRAKSGSAKPSPSTNEVMKEANEIAIESEDFDIRKVSQVIVDGKAKPITIV